MKNKLFIRLFCERSFRFDMRWQCGAGQLRVSAFQSIKCSGNITLFVREQSSFQRKVSLILGQVGVGKYTYLDWIPQYCGELCIPRWSHTVQIAYAHPLPSAAFPACQRKAFDLLQITHQTINSCIMHRTLIIKTTHILPASPYIFSHLIFTPVCQGKISTHLHDSHCRLV